MTRTTALLAVSSLAIALPSFAGPYCNTSSKNHAPEAMTVGNQSKADIVDTAVAAGSFNTLAAALKAAGLVDTLKGDGPFTVFAPTDEAFAKLPAGTVESLLRPANRDRLRAILTYHVVPGNVMAKDVMKVDAAATVNGQRVDIDASRNGVKVDGANVVKTDITTSNGVIHVIDRVILPSEKDIVQTAVDAGSFKTLAAALDAAGLVSTLQGDGPFTVFAPTDAAFAKLPAGTVESLLQPENRDKLVSILTYHVAPGRVFSTEVAGMKNVTTVQGSKAPIAKTRSGLTIDGANIVTPDIDATNGVIHVIDTVIIPD